VSRDTQNLQEKPMMRSKKTPLRAEKYKKKRPGVMQNLGRNSEGDFPLKPYPTQRFHGEKPIVNSLIQPSFVDPGSADGLFLRSLHASRSFRYP
jgi:hypothetical protein